MAFLNIFTFHYLQIKAKLILSNNLSIELLSFVRYMKIHKQNLNKYYLGFSLAFLLSFVLLRSISAKGDITFFGVFGEKFVSSASTPMPLHVIKGDGYDGQFFTRFAFNPFNFEKTAYGITVDEPIYRAQRIFYPLLVWSLSLGNLKAVPYVMVLVNVAAFLLFVLGFRKLIQHFNAHPNLIILPFFIFGLYMSLARNLSELLEICLYIWLIISMVKEKLFWTLMLATAILFTRETSIISVFPLLMASAYVAFKKQDIWVALGHVLPFILLLAWKISLQYLIPTQTATAGYQHIGLPFLGIWNGLVSNINFSSPTLIMASGFFLGYFIWQIWLVWITLGVIKSQVNTWMGAGLVASFLIWLVLGIVFNFTIWADDWGFVRVFSLWNGGALVLLVMGNRLPNKYFFMFSILLLSLTFARLIVRI